MTSRRERKLLRVMVRIQKYLKLKGVHDSQYNSVNMIMPLLPAGVKEMIQKNHRFRACRSWEALSTLLQMAYLNDLFWEFEIESMKIKRNESFRKYNKRFLEEVSEVNDGRKDLRQRKLTKGTKLIKYLNGFRDLNPEWLHRAYKFCNVYEAMDFVCTQEDSVRVAS
jgi:hypothetical protein